jgi:hypothetical protein
MTDLLTEQAAIKSRHAPIRDRSGQFIKPSAAIAARVQSERIHARLEREVTAAEHARGVAWEEGHYRALPGARLKLVEAPEYEGDLLDLVAA